MNTLGNTVGTRINVFDNLENQTVEAFNDLFPECPLNYDNEHLVTIGSPAANNCRTIIITKSDIYITETIKHKMYSDILYTLDREDYRVDERDLELESINGVTL